MDAIRQDHTLWRGTSPTLEFSVVDEDGNAVNIAGWTAAYTLRQYASAPDPPTLSKAGSIFGPSTDGKFRVSPTRAELLAVAAGRYQFTFERTNVGSEDVLAYGVTTVRLDVVNPA
jgi:hypothetical protein